MISILTAYAFNLEHIKWQQHKRYQEIIMNILQINSSARAAGSHSTRLANTLVDRLKAARRDARVTVRDLGREPHPLLDEATLQALFTPAEQRTMAQAARVALD